jgi:hypothetical protein
MPPRGAARLATAALLLLACGAAQGASVLSDVVFCARYHNEACAKPLGPCDLRTHCIALLCSGDQDMGGSCDPAATEGERPSYCAELCPS